MCFDSDWHVPSCFAYAASLPSSKLNVEPKRDGDDLIAVVAGISSAASRCRWVIDLLAGRMFDVEEGAASFTRSTRRPAKNE
jgi:hypothetical protein